MKKALASFAILITLCCCAQSALIARAAGHDLTALTFAELDQLKADIVATIRDHHEASDEEREAVFAAVKEAAEAYYARQGIAISWAWYGREYHYAQQWDFYSLSTHLDYRDADDKSHQRKVYAEVFPMDGKLTVCYLKLDDDAVIDRRSEIPERLLLDTSIDYHNARTGIYLSGMARDELDALLIAVDDEIAQNHRTSSSLVDTTYDLVKAEVEALFAARGIGVGWPWFDYSYTCDWGCYTEKTNISYTDENGKRQQRDVYAEVYNEDGEYGVYYLTIGEDVALDRRSELSSEASVKFYSSKRYERAVGLMSDGQYEQAIAAFGALGDYLDSAAQAGACQAQLDAIEYQRGEKLFDSKRYEEAKDIFVSLGDFSDSPARAGACQDALDAIQYDKAARLLDGGEYEKAAAAFSALNGYADSAEQLARCQAAMMERDYLAAKARMDGGEYEAAIAALTALGDYMDAKALIAACDTAIRDRDYLAAVALMDGGHFERAIQAFEALGGHSDSAERIETCRTALASIDRAITFPQSDITVFAKKSHKLAPAVAALNDAAPAKTKLTFASSDTSVAKVGRDGVVKAYEPGDARITCAASDNPYVIGEVLVHVVQPVSRITLDRKKATLAIASADDTGVSLPLIASVEPADAHVQTITWTSSNEKVATVDGDGVVRAVGFGRATITATSDDTSGSAKKATCGVTVAQAVTAVSIENAKDTIYIGKTDSLKASVQPKNAADKKLVWTSSDESVATVKDGKVKGVSAGSVTITATASSGASAQYDAVVKRAPTTLRITAKATLIAKNSVGHSWSKAFYIDDMPFKGNTKVTVEEGQTVRIGCEITEHDKIPDYEWMEVPLVMTPEILSQGYTIDQRVYVMENGGRYSGNEAEWRVVITIKP